MEHRGGFTYSIEKGCVSMKNADKIRAMSDEELSGIIRVIYMLASQRLTPNKKPLQMFAD